MSFTLGVALLTGVIFGLAPAWQGSRPDLNEALKEGTRNTSAGVSGARMRNALIIAEVALSTVLLIAAGLMLQSFAQLRTTDRGFHPEHVVTAELDFSVAGFTTWVRPTATRPQVRLQVLLDQLRRLPGVQSAGAAYRFLRQDNRPPVQSFTIFGQTPLPEAERPVAEHNAISPGYLGTLGIRLLRGRDLTEADTLEAPGVVLVNECFVRRFFPDSEPLGKYITMENAPGPLGATNNYGQSVWSQIVGVVSDVKSLSAQPEAAPEVYKPYWQFPMQNPTVFVRGAGDPSALATAIRRETKSAIPNLPTPKIRLLPERVDESMAHPRFQAGLLSLFALLALLLAACGIYGVLAYSVAQRQREIGIRIALGAARRDVLQLVVGQGLKLALIGVTAGLAAALAFTRVLRSLLYEVRPTEPAMFGIVALVLVLVALLACWLPARRAAHIDPTVALRQD